MLNIKIILFFVWLLLQPIIGISIIKSKNVKYKQNKDRLNTLTSVLTLFGGTCGAFSFVINSFLIDLVKTNFLLFDFCVGITFLFSFGLIMIGSSLWYRFFDRKEIK